MGALAERERRALAGPRTKCAVLKALETLDQEDGDTLLRLLYKRLDLTSEEVVEVLAPDVPMSPNAVRRHRQGKCIACRKG